MESQDLFAQLWIEKYRPKTLDDVVLNNDQKMFLQKCLEKDEIPHLMFYGPAGSGKTTTARILIDNLIHSDMDLLFINGSDDNGIQFIRDVVIEFLKTPPVMSNKKIVLLDESDGLTSNSQSILRNAMETYADNGRFIFTCNYPSKIIDPILSRTTIFEMKMMPFEFVVDFIKKILNNESIKFDDNTVEITVKSLIPDIRKIVNTIQKNCIDGKLNTISRDQLVTIENKVIGLILELCDNIGTQRQQTIVNSAFPTILKILNSNESPDIPKMYEMLFNNEKLPAWAKIKVNEYANKHQGSFSKEHNFMAMCYDILNAGLYYTKLFGIKK